SRPHRGIPRLWASKPVGACVRLEPDTSSALTARRRGWQRIFRWILIANGLSGSRKLLPASHSKVRRDYIALLIHELRLDTLPGWLMTANKFTSASVVIRHTSIR